MPAQLLQLEAAPDLVDRVYRSLLDAISGGTLAPGTRITQEEIAQQLAVSRQPVLQALRLLKKDGFVQDAPGRGLQVAPLDTVAIRNIYQVRGALDALAARLAAQRRYRMPDEVIAAGRAAARSDDVAAMIEADLGFHRAIYEAAGNPLIGESAQLHWRHLKRVMGAVLQEMGQREAVWDEHQRIADAIAAGDGERAARLIEDHSLQASRTLAERLEQVLQSAPTNDPRRQT
ncbi:GntR family transcriptional regulator [Ramlibacter sp. USB13]|uniref:GntR family transcriptional regulator n=1 Tax=Ramlibacter cellulosilyticus TaxID=2764187 RepID=A0A923SCG0_9BURK|nr:GntR family transcriptional regulator [Ramlibacter cellulosilyticus]MBC5784213.1 GntR family transcriptional regulator [Ramlibacter cellulosilyticus]